MTNFEFQIDNFMLYCTSKNLSTKTMKSYEQTLKLFSKFLEDEFKIDKVEKVSTAHIRQYIKYLQDRGKYTVVAQEKKKEINNPEARNDYGKKISFTTINNYIRNIKVFFNFLFEEAEIKRNPMSKVGFLRTQRKMKETITEEEFKKLLRAFDTTKFHGYRDYVITKLLLDTGMRIGESLALLVEDIDLKNKIILLTHNVKGNKERYVYFSFKMAEDLRRWIQYKDRYTENDLMFPSSKGNMMKPSLFERNLRETGLKVNLKIHPHQLRNQFAKQYLLNNGDLYTLSKILGHSSVQVTEKAYMDLTVEEIRRKYHKHSPLNNWNL